MGRFAIRMDFKKREGLNLPLYLPVDEDRVYTAIENLYGDRLADNGIPLAQEVAGWADLCVVGDTYETEDFVAKCVEVR